MSEYLVMSLEDEGVHEAESPDRVAALIEARAAFAEELRSAGQLADAGRFRPSKEGKRVRRVGEAVAVTDGPFADAGKTLGGYWWVRADDLGAAAEIAKRCPALDADELDVRPLMKGSVGAGKHDKPGKVFGFAVLGNASTEEAWVEVMDRIDASTQSDFPKAASLGGLRLQPPRKGRRVVTRGERRADLDGPFLESKEVIGGVFFLRMANLEEAVQWARGTGFIAHGALEIRELWRT